MPTTTDAPETPPPLAFGLTEGSRALSEYGWFLASRRWLSHHHTEAGRPVLVLPGLEAGDWSLKPLRSVLVAVGHHPYGWGLGRNIGPTERIVSGLDELVLQIRDRHDAPVSVIGQSLGGLLGRELARRHPSAIDRLITLGSQVTTTSLRQTRASKAYLRHADEHLPQFGFDQWTKAPQPAIPSTSIYSRSDGIVRWESCRYPEGPLTENIEVYSSHLGLGVQPAAVYAVLDRLETPVDDWAKFVPPARLRGYFRNSARAAA